MKIGKRFIEVKKLPVNESLALLFMGRELFGKLVKEIKLEPNDNYDVIVYITSQCTGITESHIVNNFDLDELLLLFYHCDLINNFSKSMPYIVAMGFYNPNGR